MKSIYPLLLIISLSLNNYAQTLIPIPELITGNNINLIIKDSTKQFYPGIITNTIGYNGSYLGPTILLKKGETVTLNVQNKLKDTTTTHWHGLHVAPMNDGSPHNPILVNNTWSPTFKVMDNAATYWYHPHLHGKTLKQVVKGAAGLIIVQDDEEASLNLPRNYGVDDIPLIFQFQTINTTTKQIEMNDEFDNVTMVNGTLNPMTNLPAQLVRLRLLNASSHRVLQLGFSDNRTFYQITSDDGLLNSPVQLTRLRLGSGERAEILVDLTGQSGSNVFINQYGNELPSGFPGGPAMMGGTGPLDNITFNFLKINITNPTNSPITAIPINLTTNVKWSTANASSMNFLLQGSPAMSMTNFTINNAFYNEDIINFSKNEGEVMVWNITNQSMMAHPFHIHGNHFYILAINGTTPPANLQGRKDVVLIAPQGGTVSLITKYEDYGDSSMPFMYHCHILSHEDNGMMGQFIVNPKTKTGINTEQLNNFFTIYPNPSGDQLIIDSKEEVIVTELNILNMLGEKLLETRPISPTGSKLNLTELPQGMYVIQIISNIGIYKKVFIRK